MKHRCHYSHFSCWLLSVLVLVVCWTSISGAPHDAQQYTDKILLQDIQTLTLHKDQMTTGRRTAPIPQVTNIFVFVLPTVPCPSHTVVACRLTLPSPALCMPKQLQCVGGSAHCEYTPEAVQCYNKGSDAFGGKSARKFVLCCWLYGLIQYCLCAFIWPLLTSRGPVEMWRWYGKVTMKSQFLHFNSVFGLSTRKCLESQSAIHLSPFSLSPLTYLMPFVD